MSGRVGAPVVLRAAPHYAMGALAGGAAAAGVAPVPPIVAMAVASVAGAVALAAIRRGRAGVALPLVLVCAAAGAWGWGSHRIGPTAPQAPSAPAWATGVVEVDGVPRSVAGGDAHRMRVRAVGLSGVPSGARLIAYLRRDQTPALGARLRIAGRLGPAAGAGAPGWWRAYARRERIAGAVDVSSARVIGRRGGLRGARDRLRIAAARAAGAGLEGERREVVRGMALGGGDGLSQETAERLRDAGIWHLLAVSGQNVAMVAMAVLTSLRALGLRRRPAVAVSGAVLVVYLLACDGGASVVRAGIVGVLVVIGELGSRGRDRWHLLLVGLAALLLHQPRAIGDPGLQLSFAAVIGLFVVAPPLSTFAAPFIGRTAALLLGHAVGATVATAPVVAWHFGEISLIGLAVNLVAVPLAAPIVVTALAGIVAGAIVPPLAVAAGALAGEGASLLLAIGRVAAAVPGATVEVPGWAAAVLVSPLVLIPAAFGRLWARSGPPVPSRMPGRARACLGAAAVAAVATLVPAPGRVAAWPGAPAVTALDIGQGDAILLRSPDGGTALVDTGPPGTPAPVLDALRRAGVARLDLLAITHDQRDHSGAAAEILSEVPVGRFLTPVAAPAAERAARRAGVTVVRVGRGDRLRIGGWDVEVLWPRRGDPAPADPNDASLVAVARAPGVTALLTGDAESGVLARLSPPPVDILKVSHHGSADPGLEPLLARLRPRVALVSVGNGNRYGHPDPATLQVLASAGVATVRTDRSGSITARGADGAVAVERER